jgi:uncharacterized protein YbaR (Trm112 family)
MIPCCLILVALLLPICEEAGFAYPVVDGDSQMIPCCLILVALLLPICEEAGFAYPVVDGDCE